MDQQVYMDLDGLRFIQQQNSEDHLQQQFQSQGIIMSGSDQSQQDLPDDHSQHVLYSTMKQNEQNQQTQYILHDDSMQNHFLIQTSPVQQQSQQVFYTNSSQSHHNLIAHQNQQKVIIIISFKISVKKVIPHLVGSASS